MLHYSVDNELMSDLYRDYRQMKGAEYAQLHELGEHYLSLIEGYDLEESTIKTLQGLVPVSYTHLTLPTNSRV